MKRLGVLFSGGKDSTLALSIAKEYKYSIACLITLEAENKESYMFHTPTINKTSAQAQVLNIPQIIQKTKGNKETELKDLKKAIQKAIKEYAIEGIVTGAVESVYQATRIQKICNELDIECFNPLWQKPQEEILTEIVRKKFEVILTGVAAYPLDKTWLARKINPQFINEIMKLHKKYGINPAGEGGEYETFVLNCSLFKKPIILKSKEVIGEGNAVTLELNLQ